MASDALEQALALQRAPFLRQSLSARPLPDDIAGLIQVSSGSSILLAEAAQRSGETAKSVLEAARFYLQEVMFFPAADAYRILGVVRDAPDEQIKTNYRLLQRWLHPDRDDGDGMSVHASRVNQAWAALRSPERRSAYDAKLAREEAATPEVDGVVIARPRVILTDWYVEAKDNRTLLRNLPLAALLGGCLLLGIMSVRQMQVEPPAWEPTQQQPGPPALTIDENAGDADSLYASSAASPGGPVMHDRTLIRAKQPDSRPASVLVPFANDARMVENGATASRLSKVAATPLMAADEGVALPASVADTVRRVAPSVENAVDPGSIPLQAPTRLSSPSSSPVLTSKGQPAHLHAAARAGQPQPPAIVEPLPDDGVPDEGVPEANFAQVIAAQQRAHQIAMYLAAADSRAPPVWNDLGTQQQAERLRRALHGRNAALDSLGQSFALTDPQWRIRVDAAMLDSGYRLAGTRYTAETGRLRMTMVWREGRWLVSRVLLNPAEQ